jgi:RHS repeat-associated protein
MRRAAARARRRAARRATKARAHRAAGASASVGGRICGGASGGGAGSTRLRTTELSYRYDAAGQRYLEATSEASAGRQGFEIPGGPWTDHGYKPNQGRTTAEAYSGQYSWRLGAAAGCASTDARTYCMWANYYTTAYGGTLDASGTYAFKARMKAAPGHGDLHVELKYRAGGAWQYAGRVPYTASGQAPGGAWQTVEATLDLAAAGPVKEVQAIIRHLGNDGHAVAYVDALELVRTDGGSGGGLMAARPRRPAQVTYTARGPSGTALGVFRGVAAGSGQPGSVPGAEDERIEAFAEEDASNGEQAHAAEALGYLALEHEGVLTGEIGGGMPVGYATTVRQGQPDPSTWHTLTVPGDYRTPGGAPPVVLAQVASADDVDGSGAPRPVHVRIRHVRTTPDPATGAPRTEAEWQLEEWSYQHSADPDGRAHPAETVAFLVLRQGRYMLTTPTGTGGGAQGAVLAEVGTVAASHQWAAVTLGRFQETPVVLAQGQTRNGGQPMVTRLRGVAAGDPQAAFEVRVQEEQVQPNHGGGSTDHGHATEQVGYAAFLTADGTSKSGQLEVGGVPTKYFLARLGGFAGTDAGGVPRWAEVPTHGLGRVAVAVGQLQTYNGAGPASARVRTGAGRRQHWNVVAGGRVIGRHEVGGAGTSAGADSTARRYYLTDLLGSVRAVVDGTGAVVQAQDFYPFGLPMDRRSRQQGTPAEENFTGYEYDRETGLLYAGRRMYLGALGRFTTRDRFEDKYPSLSPYQYAANNPALIVDVNGDSLYVENEEDRKGGFFARLRNFLGNGKKVTYVKREDGYYNTETGEKADPEVGGYLAEVSSAVDRLTSTPSGRKLVGTFSSSETNHITIRKGSNRYRTGGKTLHSTVFWDPDDTSGGPSEGGSTRRPAFVGLGHEIGHAYDDFGYDGTMGTTPGVWLDANGDPVIRSTGETVKRSEIYASWVENQIRAEHNLPRRTHYAAGSPPRLRIPVQKPSWLNF